MEKSMFQNKVWHTPLLPAIPDSVAGEAASVRLANRRAGEWSFLFREIADIPSPHAQVQDYPFDRIAPEEWKDVIVPSALTMQGYDIKNNREYYYKTTISVPPHFAGKRILLRFEGVYSNARIWVDNRYVRSHIGGFTAFDCDITDFLHGPEATLVVGVADLEGSTRGVWNPDGKMCGDPSWASFYAHCNIGGILRGVTLFALPSCFIGRTHIQTAVQEQGGVVQRVRLAVCVPRDTDPAALSLSLSLKTAQGGKAAEETLCLSDAQKVPGEPDEGYGEPYDSYEAEVLLPVRDPAFWSAEDPYLYTLALSLRKDGREMQANTVPTGLRLIEYGGMGGTRENGLFVNGKEVKLRGVCRHDVSWRYGRSMTEEEELQEILSYKRSNVNFIRTSHYPASESLLRLCDKYGLYVELENAACFKGANDVEIYCPPEDFVGEFTEMVESARNHPCVLIWSLGNESGFEKTSAFRTEYDYIKAADPSRPVIFSYPDTVASGPLPYDIYSMHYQDVNGALGLEKLPKLHDEFAHVSCYNLGDLQQDNACRGDAWGGSIQKGWDNIFRTEGALGCAIWAAADDVFLLPAGVAKRHQIHSEGRAAGYGEWGCILDVYQRLKPEAFYVKKAFSPIVVEKGSRLDGDCISFCLTNRFDHTGLDNVRLRCTDEEGNVLYDGMLGAGIPPHETGWVKAALARACPSVLFSFYHGGIEVENGVLRSEAPAALQADAPPVWLTFSETEEQVVYRSVKRSLSVSKLDGSILLYDGQNGAPLARQSGLYLKGVLPPQLTNVRVSYRYQEKTAYLSVEREYSRGFRENIEIQFNGNRASFAEHISFPMEYRDAIERAGVRFWLYRHVDAVSWKKAGLYERYPADHIGRCEGTAYAVCAEAAHAAWGEKPSCGWGSSMTDYFLYPGCGQAAVPVTNDFKTTRDQIESYTVHWEGQAPLRIVPGSGSLSAVVRKGEARDELLLSTGGYYPGLSWGNDCGRKLSQNSAAFAFFVEGPDAFGR